MQFNLSRNELLFVLNACNRVVQTNSPLESATGALFRTGEDAVFVQVTDLRVFAEVRVSAEVQKPGMCVVPFKKLHSLVRLLPDGTNLSLVSDGVKTLIKYNGSRMELVGFNPEEFPVLPEKEFLKATETEIAPETLFGAFRRVAYASSTDELRPIFTGIWLEGGETGFTLACSDGYRLATEYVPTTSKKDLAEKKVALPVKGFDLAMRLAAYNKNPVRFILEETIASISGEWGKVSMLLIEGKFPEWRGVFPKETPVKAQVSASDLIAAAERAKLVAPSDDVPVGTLEVLAGRVFLRSESDVGKAEESVAAKTEGSTSVNLNLSFLLDALKAVGEGDAILRFAGSPTTSVVVEFSATPNHRALILSVVR